jgi:hypothetical protein
MNGHHNKAFAMITQSLVARSNCEIPAAPHFTGIDFRAPPKWDGMVTKVFGLHYTSRQNHHQQLSGNLKRLHINTHVDKISTKITLLICQFNSHLKVLL